MLQALREGAKLKIVKFTLFGILGMAMFGLVLMDVAGVFGRGGTGTNKVAEIGGEKIALQEFDRAYRRTLQQLGIDSESARQQGVLNLVLVQEINSRLMSRAARDMGLVVSREIIARNIKDILSPYAEQQDGVSEKELLKRLLYSRNQNEQEFAALLAHQMTSGQIAAAVASGAYAPQQLVRDIARYQNEERKASYFLISSSDLIREVPQPTEEELASYYETVAANFKTSEYRKIKIALLKPEKLGETLTISPEQLEAAYEERVDEYALPERRLIEQAATGSRETAEKIIAEAQKTGTLGAAVKKLGGATDIYYEPKEMTKTSLAPELSDVAFTLENNAYSAPVESELGWHVLHVQQILPAKTKTLAEVSDSLEKELIEEQVSKSLYESANKFDDLLAGGLALDEAAQELVLPVLAYAPVTRQGMGESGNDDVLTMVEKEKILETAFGLAANESSPLLETADGGFIAVEVSEIIPQKTRGLKDVKEEVTRMWREGKTRELLKKRSEELLTQIKDGKSLNELAAALGKTPQESPFIKRSSKESASDTPQGLVGAVFSLDKPGASVTFQNADGMVIASLSERRLDDKSSEEDIKNIGFILNRSMQEDLLTGYRQGLMARYNVKVHEQTLQDMYNSASNDTGS